MANKYGFFNDANESYDIRVRVTFIEPVLGTWPANQNIAREFIASKSPDASTIEDEVAAIGAEEVANKAMTVFPRNAEGDPVFYDYQIKGFFKDTCKALARNKTGHFKKLSADLKAYKQVIDKCVFVAPRMIPIEASGEIGDCQRPLRAQTAQGERVSLANSEEIPEDSTCEFVIQLNDEKLEDLVIEWMNYGKKNGLGQWRNSGRGRFLYEILDADGKVLGGNK